MQARQRVVADIDAKYTRELTDAKATINQLERSVIVGNQRLRINAICKPMSGIATATPGATNATAPRLADAAQRNYFILIERLTQMEKQMEGLQEYVRSQCH
ncbi:lysis protein [Serratia symbiotica]|nr:lysis protein [Serratia symbiotica]